MSPDEKALNTLRTPGWDPNDLHDRFVTEEAVKAYLAPYLDQHPDGTPLYRHRMPHPWQGPRNASGSQTYLPSLWAILDTVSDPKDLTSKQVVHLVVTSTDNESYTKDDWDHMVAGKIAEAACRETNRRKKERGTNADERAERGGRTRNTIEAPAGYRVVPDSDLPHRTKIRRSKSLKAAQERREERRKVAVGVTIQHRKTDWRDMLKEDVEAHRKTIDALVQNGTIDNVFPVDHSGKRLGLDHDDAFFALDGYSRSYRKFLNAQSRRERGAWV